MSSGEPSLLRKALVFVEITSALALAVALTTNEPSIAAHKSIIATLAGLALFSTFLAAEILHVGGIPGKTEEDFARELDELEQKGLITRKDFEATRCFQLREFEDLGSNYFVELADRSVIFLTGQYLYDYEPIIDSGIENQPRRFPCTRFTLRIEKKFGNIEEIICGGEVLEPEVNLDVLYNNDFEMKELPQDGEIIMNETYVLLKLRYQSYLPR